MSPIFTNSLHLLLLVSLIHSFHVEQEHAINSDVLPRIRRAAVADSKRLWDYGVIPFEISSIFNATSRRLLFQAMRTWERHTCVRFVERSKTEHPNYIRFTVELCGCCSNVGKVGHGVQIVSIGESCETLGIVLHELGHTLGYYHEHSRPDRHWYIKVIWDNIKPGFKFNFEKYTENEINSRGFPYDYASIMHYERNSGSKGDDLSSIVRVDWKNEDVKMSQMRTLSQGDIDQTNFLYQCSKCGRTIQNSSGIIDFSSDKEEYCEWSITAAHGQVIELKFDDFEFYWKHNCQDEYLMIHDGYWFKSPLLVIYCEEQYFPIKEQTLITTGNRMLIRLKTLSNSLQHFYASYKVLCGGYITSQSGYLQSPFYPQNYPSNQYCEWKISVPLGHRIFLKFHWIDLESDPNCRKDFIELRDGHQSDSPLLGRYCGSKLPESIQSTRNRLYVRFVSDSTVNRAGFEASFETMIDMQLELVRDKLYNFLDSWTSKTS